MQVKKCWRCNKKKEITEFATLLGRRLNVCLACESERVTAHQRRHALNNPEYREHRLDLQEASKKRYPNKTKLQEKVIHESMKRIRDRHREEYDKILVEVREELGLPPSNRYTKRVVAKAKPIE